MLALAMFAPRPMICHPLRVRDCPAATELFVPLSESSRRRDGNLGGRRGGRRRARGRGGRRRARGRRGGRRRGGRAAAAGGVTVDRTVATTGGQPQRHHLLQRRQERDDLHRRRAEDVHAVLDRAGQAEGHERLGRGHGHPDAAGAAGRAVLVVEAHFTVVVGAVEEVRGGSRALSLGEVLVEVRRSERGDVGVVVPVLRRRHRQQAAGGDCREVRLLLHDPTPGPRVAEVHRERGHDHQHERHERHEDGHRS